jgi:tRNA(Ile)-lysidine synthase TilS/MesJ
MIEERHPGTRFQLLKSTDELIPILRKGIDAGPLTRCGGCGEITSGAFCRVCQIREELGF